MDFSNIPKGLGQWIFCAAFTIAAVLWGSNELLRLVKTLRGAPPQPPNETLLHLADDLHRRVSALETIAKEERDAATRSRAGIYRKIDEVSDGLRGDTAELRKEMNDRFDSLPERIINLVRNMK